MFKDLSIHMPIWMDFDDLKPLYDVEKEVHACLSLHGVQKHWWSPELDKLKQQYVDARDLWKTFGRPRSAYHCVTSQVTKTPD